MEIRTAFYRSSGAHALHFVDADGVPEVSLTRQSDRDQTDVNRIISRYRNTGLIDHVAKGRAQYGDFTSANEYQESLNLVIAAQASFAELPSDIRARFNNDPGSFFEFATDPKNKTELIELGLANADPLAPAPLLVEVVNPVPAG